MTSRGRTTLALGLVVYVAAWTFGSRPLYPVAVGLLLAPLVAWAWVRLAAQPMDVRRRHGAHDAVEGDDVRVQIEVRPTAAVPPPSLEAVEQLNRLGRRSVPLTRHGRFLVGAYELERVPRGRYGFDAVELVIEDPFGLERVVLRRGEPEALVVYPRLVQLDRLFSEGGPHAQDGRQLLLRRPTGYELHSVREYERGDSLRKVHWRSTARRGELMVKELEDAPRDEIAVLLDGDAAGALDELFDVSVRAAGSILSAHVRRGRRCVLVVNSALREVQQVSSEAGDWRRALEVLAAVEPTAKVPATALLGGESTPVGRALELVVVTSRLTPPLVDRLVQRALSRRATSLVYVHGTRRPEPALLRLSAAGVPVAVVHPADDLAAALSPAAQEVAVG